MTTLLQSFIKSSKIVISKESILNFSSCTFLSASLMIQYYLDEKIFRTYLAFGDIWKLIEDSSGVVVLTFFVGCSLFLTGLGLLAWPLFHQLEIVTAFISRAAVYIRDSMISIMGLYTGYALMDYIIYRLLYDNLMILFCYLIISLLSIFLARLPLDANLENKREKFGSVLCGILLCVLTPVLMNHLLKIATTGKL